MEEKPLNCDLSVVIPCLNEEKTVGICIEKCLKAFKRLDITGEIVVSDNGSTEKTIEIAQSLGAKVVSCDIKGYGSTLQNGFCSARGKYVLMADADDSYDFNQIDIFYNAIQEGYDMVIGTRIKGNIHKGAMPFLNRYLGTPVLTLLVRLFWGIDISDSQCGMRMIKKEVLDKLNFKSTGMEFASEVLIKAAQNNWSIKEIPIEFFKDGRGRKPHLRPWRDGLRHLNLILKMKFLKDY